jgi:DNA-binding GntR family transcriptional regulator
MEKAGRKNDETVFMRLDREFNLLGLQAARNEFAAGAMVLMQGLSRRFWFIHYKEAADLPLAAQLHADIARAIASADRDGAAAASDRLMDYIEAFTRGTLTSG